MKYLLMIIFFLIYNVGILFQNEIKWTPDTKLTWSDFKEKIDKTSKECAFLNGGIDYNEKQENDTILVVMVYAYYDKKLSAKSDDRKCLTQEVLRHEQGHFDINEWYARIVRKRLIDTTLTRFNQVSPIINRNYKEAWEMEKRYDQETNHAIDTLAQHKWDSLIASKLQEYSAYSGTELRIHIRKK